MAQFTKYTGNVTGVAGDLLTMLDTVLVTGEGWTKDYTGVNKATYRPAAGCQLYLRVQDDAPGAGGAREARVRGYEAMTDVDTGTGLFPTVAQAADGLYVRKSSSADATNRPYIVFADDRTFYAFILTGDIASTYFAFAFGDFYSLVSADAYRAFLIARVLENSGAAAGDTLDLLSSNVGVATSYHCMPRGHTGLGSAVIFGVHGDYAKSTTSSLYGTIPFTNPSNGGLYLSPVWIHDKDTAPVYGLRGRMRGFWHFLHPVASVAHGDTFSGTGDLAGKTFEIVKLSGNGAIYTIETSNTLETN